MTNRFLCVAGACIVMGAGTNVRGQPAAGEESMLKGTVREVQASGRYSYLHVDTGTGLQWVACYQVEAKAGDPVRVGEGKVMIDFTSPTLKRTFDRIIFASRVQVGTNPPPSAVGHTLPPGHPATGQPSAGKKGGSLPPGHPPVGAKTDDATADRGTAIRGVVVEAIDAGGYTYVNFEGPTGLEWAAGNQFKVAKGDRVVMSEGMVMRDFESPSLNRRFAALRFVDWIHLDDGKAKASGLPPGHP